MNTYEDKSNVMEKDAEKKVYYFSTKMNKEDKDQEHAINKNLLLLTKSFKFSQIKTAWN